MNENFNGLNEASSLDNNEVNNQNNLEPTLNGTNNTEVLNMEGINPIETNVIPENNINVLSESVSVPEMGATELIRPMSENVSTNMNNTNIESKVIMTSSEPVTFNTVNNSVNNFQSGINPTNSEINMDMSKYPTTPNVGSSYGNVAPISEPEKKKNNFMMFLIIVLVVALGAIGGLFAYKWMIMSNPVSIVEKSLTAFGKEAKTAIKEYNTETKKMLNKKINSEISFEFNEYSGNLVLNTDFKNKRIQMTVDAKQDGEELLNVEGVVDEEAAYFKFLKDSSNIFKHEEDFLKLFDVIENEQEIDPILVNFITYLGDSVKEVFTKEDFTKDKVEIDLNGKKVNATKYTLPVNDSTINPLLDNYKDKLISDDSLISYLTDFVNDNNQFSTTKITKADMMELIETLIDDMKLTSFDNKENLKLDILVSGTELLGITFGIDGNNKIEFYFNDLIELNYWVDGEKVLTMKLADDEFKMNIETPEDYIIVDCADGKYKIDINIDDESLIFDGTYNITDTIMELTFNTKIMGEKYVGKITAKETIADDLEIIIPPNALNVEDENNQTILMEELEKMPIYPYIEEYVNPNYGYADEYYYDNEDNYDYVTNLDYDSKWEF